jgi:hypothetical protein
VGATPFVDPVFGFLGTSRFAAKTPGFGDYTSLDSLARNKTYQRVTRDFRSTILRRAFAAANKPSKRRPTIRYTTRTDCSSSKLTSTSDFLQEIAA